MNRRYKLISATSYDKNAIAFLCNKHFNKTKPEKRKMISLRIAFFIFLTFVQVDMSFILTDAKRRSVNMNCLLFNKTSCSPIQNSTIVLIINYESLKGPHQNKENYFFSL